MTAAQPSGGIGFPPPFPDPAAKPQLVRGEVSVAGAPTMTDMVAALLLEARAIRIGMELQFSNAPPNDLEIGDLLQMAADNEG